MIGEVVGLKKSAVYGKIDKINEILQDFTKNPNSEFKEKYPNLYQKWQKIPNFTPLLYNIWNVNRNKCAPNP
ncbi:MAG: hypothetical protein KKB09_07115 [Nanoarchaeota archaeon]|nr:hypothetical protein [Nanoarchaeota archaeon]